MVSWQKQSTHSTFLPLSTLGHNLKLSGILYYIELKDVAALLIALFVEIKDVEIGGVESATPKEIINVDFEDVTQILKLIHVLLRPFTSFTSLISTSPHLTQN